MGSGSKGKRPFPGLRFDVRVGNANTMMMLNWDAGVRGRGRKRGGGRGGEGIEAMSETIPQQKGSASH